jgi:serine/threonine-protein kinase
MTSASTSEILEPDLGRYRLIAELARGGMGNVYLAVAQGPAGFNKLLVVKELKPELCDEENYVAMFLEEARLAARLTHPNIVQTNEVGSDGHRHFMTMEYLDGRSLYRVVRHLANQGGLPIGAHLRVIAESLLGLHYAHELRGFAGEALGVVHRDVSPLNVVVTFDGQAKVLDFGIAKAVDSALETQAGVLKGRIAYMAPEQACGGKVDRRADVYSAGVMIWEAAAGRRLWQQMTEVEILSQLLREGPPRLRSVRPDAPADLDAICARALARDADDRYASAEALRLDLEAHLARRSDAMSMRDVGALIGNAFQGERGRMNAIIEETLARARVSPASGSMRQYPGPVSSSGTHSVSRSRPVGEELLSMSSILAATPSRAISPDDPRLERVGTVVSASSAPSPSARPVRHALVGGMIAFGLVGAAAVGFLAHRSPAAETLAAPPAAVPASPEPAAAASPTVDLVVRVTPLGSQIALDGQALAGDPAHLRVPRDGSPHRITATADGYETKTEDVTLSSDTSIDISLDRRTTPARGVFAPRWMPPPAASARAPKAAAEPAHAGADAPPVTPPPPAHNDAVPAAGKAPLRAIVTSNPYGAQ